MYYHILVWSYVKVHGSLCQLQGEREREGGKEGEGERGREGGMGGREGQQDIT